MLSAHRCEAYCLPYKSPTRKLLVISLKNVLVTTNCRCFVSSQKNMVYVPRMIVDCAQNTHCLLVPETNCWLCPKHALIVPKQSVGCAQSTCWLRPRMHLYCAQKVVVCAQQHVVCAMKLVMCIYFHDYTWLITCSLGKLWKVGAIQSFSRENLNSL